MSSRSRRVIRWEYWLPKSRTRIVSNVLCGSPIETPLVSPSTAIFAALGGFWLGTSRQDRQSGREYNFFLYQLIDKPERGANYPSSRVRTSTSDRSSVACEAEEHLALQVSPESRLLRCTSKMLCTLLDFCESRSGQSRWIAQGTGATRRRPAR